MIRLPLLGFATVLTAVSVAASTPTASHILAQQRARDDTERRWTDRSQHMTMTIRRSDGQDWRRSMTLYARRFESGDNKVLVFFGAPRELKGLAFLQWSIGSGDTRQWIMLPNGDRPRQVTATDRDQSFAGSDFAYRDFDILERIPRWAADDGPAVLLKDEPATDGDLPCYTIELRPARREGGYGKILVRLDHGELLMRTVEFRDVDGEPVKMLTLGDFRPVGNIPTAHRLEMRSLKRSSHTSVELSEVAYDIGLREDLFTQAQLQRGPP
jgi:hypothetical protein